MISMLFLTAAAGVNSGASAAAAPGFMTFIVSNVVPLLMIFVVFYFLLIRPQQKRAKDQAAKIDAVQKNDEVITGGGLMGKVTKVTEEYVEVEIAPSVKVKVVKSTLTHVQSRAAKASND